jgi:hypothetical protein
MSGSKAWWRATAMFAAAWLAGGCTTLDELAVGETRRLEEGVFHADLAGGPAGAVDPVLVLLPPALDPELVTTPGYAGRASQFQPLLAAVAADLGARTCCRGVDGSGLPAGGPRLYVGSADGVLAPPAAAEVATPADRFAPMVLHLERPSAPWQTALAALLAREGARHAVVIGVTVSQYPKGRAGAFAKQVQIGTGLVEPVRFLSAEDRLIEVLQFTGILIDAQGRVVRAAAEGFIARDTPFAAQVLGADKLLTDDTLERAAVEARRRDLPGAPLRRTVALENLLAQLRGDAAALVVP